MKIRPLGYERYKTDRRTAHVPAMLEMLPKDSDLSSLLNDFHAHEVLHVTFGSALAQFGVELKAALIKHENAYDDGLRSILKSI